jgi:aminopeptidase N
VSTHPISLPVEETISAVNTFDDICYKKGASFVKVMANLVGREILGEAIKEYMRLYSFKCAKLLAFIDVLEDILKKRDVKDIDIKEFAN